jgi:hypothetical protein
MATGLNDKLLNNPIIYSQNGLLHIENIEANSAVKVYDVTGKIRYSGKMLNSSVRLKLNNGSVYLVKINDKIYKLVL